MSKTQPVFDRMEDQQSGEQADEEFATLAPDPGCLTPEEFLAYVKRFPNKPDEKRLLQNTKNEEDISLCPLKLSCCTMTQEVLRKDCRGEQRGKRCV